YIVQQLYRTIPDDLGPARHRPSRFTKLPRPLSRSLGGNMRRIGGLFKWGFCGFIALALVIAAVGCDSRGGSGGVSQEFEKPENLPTPKKVRPVKPDRYSDLSPREKRALKKDQ